MDLSGREQRNFQVHLTHLERYQFESQASEDGLVHGVPFRSDEPDPVGDAAAPATPSLLGAALGHCLSASLLEALRHAHLPVLALETDVICAVVPNEQGLPRIDHVDVVIMPTLAEAAARARRCEELFEQHCTVTSSVREGIDIRVKVEWQTAAPVVADPQPAASAVG
jgi:organic hydroperoxide reductase OsmC/OhrA